METEILQKKNIRRAALWAFIFMAAVVVLSALLSSIPVPAYTFTGVALLVVSLLSLRDKSGLDTDCLTHVENPMTPAHFLAVLGAFFVGKLICMGLAAGLITSLESRLSALSESLTADTTAADKVMQFVVLGVITPFAEEVIFRGAVGRRLKGYGVWFAMLGSSLLFAIYHGNCLQLVSAFLPGVVLYYVAMNYSVKWSMLLHFINNGILAYALPELLGLAGIDQNTAMIIDYAFEGCVILAALIAVLTKRNDYLPRVKAFLAVPAPAPKAWKQLLVNVFFILMVVIMILMSIAMLISPELMAAA